MIVLHCEVFIHAVVVARAIDGSMTRQKAGFSFVYITHELCKSFFIGHAYQPHLELMAICAIYPLRMLEVNTH